MACISLIIIIDNIFIMPIHIDHDKKGNYVRWGNSGKKYYFKNTERSFTIALNKCKKQMKAIYSSGYEGQ
jgi:hypothetical protein